MAHSDTLVLLHVIWATRDRRVTLDAELSNAHLKQHHGLAQILVRGIEKVTCVALLGALAANLLQHAAALLALSEVSVAEALQQPRVQFRTR